MICPCCGEGYPQFLSEETMSVNDIQVGGSHYKTRGSAMQHWDLVELHGVGYLEAAATKYIQRRKDPKARLQDLEKSGHYTDKLIELNAKGLRWPRGSVPQREINNYCREFGLNEIEKTAITMLFRWRDAIDLHSARACIDQLVANEKAEQEGKASA
jgi:hypothetical protein